MESTSATGSHKLESFTFGTIDYIVFIIMLLISAGIGVYFGFFSKAKNTTDEYLMGGKKMKTIPIAISLIASQLSGIAIMAVPAETYSFGATYFIFIISISGVIPLLCYIIIPVFYENNISNCYEYLELRFNKLVRQFVTATFVLNAFLMLPVYLFIPSLAFSQVTGVNVHMINSIGCFVCVFYTMLGGIKAVVWTDVVQGGIMLCSVFTIAAMSVVKVGGLGTVIERAEKGGRMDLDFSWDPRIRSSVWNCFAGGLLLWSSHIGLSQSCVQRIVSLPSIDHAKRSLKIAGVGIILLLFLNGAIGIVMFARYYGCDPVMTKVVAKADKLVPYFVQDVMGHLHGMAGIFISCVFSAALSTMSAWLNSLSGVVYFDYIKPFVRHTEPKANFIMKTIVVVMGTFSVIGGLVVEKFSSIMQIVVTISGITYGVVVGIFLLGMFVPRVSGKAAATSVSVSVMIMTWIIVNAQILLNEGTIKYDPIPSSIDQCEVKNYDVLITSRTNISETYLNTTQSSAKLETLTEPLVTTAFSSNRPFSIYDISFYWFNFMGVFFVWIIGIPLSYLWKLDTEEVNPKLYTPIVRRFLRVKTIQLEEIPLRLPMTKNDPDYDS